MTRSPTSKQLAFASWLMELTRSNDRATLAHLRKGLTLDEEFLFDLYSAIPASFLQGLTPGKEHVYLMVAALYSNHQIAFTEEALTQRRRNLGESVRMLALAKAASPIGEQTESDHVLPESLKRRFEALLAAPWEELFGHLRQVMSLLKTEEIPVDWAQLLFDLEAWDWQDHPVQWQWSRAFYVGYADMERSQAHVS